MPPKNFGQVVEFLNQHVETVVLGDEEGAQVVVVPKYQGRTMTSTSRGLQGTSYGWINFAHIESGKVDPCFNLYGGEDRFWISPEGGQYSIFFEPDAPMTLANWRVPKLIDTEPFDIVERDSHRVQLTKRGTMLNYSRFEFQVELGREVVLLDDEAVSSCLDCEVDGLTLVAHESRNRLCNIGSEPWRPDTGLIGIWTLNMNVPSPNATVMVPFQQGSVVERGPIVNADYFGKLDSNRLVVDEAQGVIYFLGDGQHRSKLGLSFERAKNFMGSWDPTLGVLTVAQYNLPDSAEHGYSNNLWEVQKEPYRGDVINSYNDGPNEAGGLLGPFFELETISPALALAPNESFTHVHRTIRIEAERPRLDAVSRHVFGVGLDEIEKQFK